MRFKIVLQLPDPPAEIPINYQQSLLSWFQEEFTAVKKGICGSAHDPSAGKLPYFTFSRLLIPKRKVINDRLVILCNEIEMQLGVYAGIEELNLIKESLQTRRVTIGDCHSKAELYVKNIKTLPEPGFSREMYFYTLSPVCISNDKKKIGQLSLARYIHPEEENYPRLFFDKLIERFTGALQEFPGLQIDTGDLDRSQGLCFRLMNKPRSRLITMKPFERGQTRVRGYQYRFCIKAPGALVEFGWHAGFGENCISGFGMCDIL